ncbi:single-strand selective monofunctional uracil DNA glycosylase-like isoform X1 [Teleopsis dalmanni]|uniref:single-strand selective monofunctional uracil DNA glycosylase-like isoform X1 n=1 Tax=Teleopsis dalmanni TaxID=139649 RepID=UPI0018CCE462|nr:single-strand selective monofunctional uracil DNA glycosylase-like isoform X1 [Teleopsis dalmanni]
MLKNKLKRKLIEVQNGKETINVEPQKQVLATSPLFPTPLWQQFFEIEAELNEQLLPFNSIPTITHIYNPLEYAANIHCAYLNKYLTKPKRLVFVGMNPGANGMGQTGVPFGNIKTVRNVMHLSGEVKQPPNVHPKRLVTGMACTTEEPSGVRIWGLFQKIAHGSLDVFSELCFMHNFCPLMFFDRNGKNITPSELKGDAKLEIRRICLNAFDKEMELLKPEIIVAVGEYVHTSLKNSKHFATTKILKLAHPSPRSLNNQNWPEKAEKWLIENDLIKYLRNEL